MWQQLAALLAVVRIARTCDGHDHDHAHERLVRRSSSSSVIAAPKVPLEWGDINFIHTTDSHGWLLGHQKLSPPEPNYSGDLGTFSSFVSHMKAKALEKNVDLLLIDSGDLHDGNGLTDGGPPGSVDAHDANKFVAQLPYDVMAIGNHELYIYANTLDMHTNFVPKLNGRYLSSNVNITVFDKTGKNVSVPVGDRFTKFKTRLGRQVTALGVLYNFDGNDVNTTVQPVADMVKEQWFAEAIKEEPDFFLLVGHMPVQKDNWPAVFNAVRAVHPLTPIFIFGGHTHIRDCVQLDNRSMSLESGRYFETVGWMSADLKGKTGKNNKEAIKFTRRYLDPNNVTYAFHTGVSAAFAHTPLGEEITSGLNGITKKYDLTLQYGTAPQDFHIDAVPFPSNSSLLSLLADQVLPIGLGVGNNRSQIPNIMITNSGSLRFDILKGTFTKNDQLIASPFDDTFLYIPNVPFSVAKQVPDEINKSGQDVKRKRALGEREIRERQWEERMWKKGYVGMRFDEWRREMWEREVKRHPGGEAALLERATQENATLGYVTQDACPGVGDDTVHTAIPFFSTPDFVASPNPNVTDDTLIDLVFVDFIESDILTIVSNFWNKTVTESDVLSYTNTTAAEVFGVFAQQAWN